MLFVVRTQSICVCAVDDQQVNTCSYKSIAWPFIFPCVHSFVRVTVNMILLTEWAALNMEISLTQKLYIHVCTSYSYIVCIQFSMFMKGSEHRRATAAANRKYLA